MVVPLPEKLWVNQSYWREWFIDEQKKVNIPLDTAYAWYVVWLYQMHVWYYIECMVTELYFNVKHALMVPDAVLCTCVMC